MPIVNFNGRTVTDSVVKQVLENMAKFYNSPVNVTSGDRSHVPPGGSTTSLHLSGRAADLSIVGQSLEVTYLNLRNLAANSVFVPGHGYEFIWHGDNTSTSGAHLHKGRIGEAESGYVKFIKERVTPDGSGKYPVDLRVVLLGQISGLLKWL